MNQLHFSNREKQGTCELPSNLQDELHLFTTLNCERVQR